MASPGPREAWVLTPCFRSIAFYFSAKGVASRSNSSGGKIKSDLLRFGQMKCMRWAARCGSQKMKSRLVEITRDERRRKSESRITIKIERRRPAPPP